MLATAATHLHLTSNFQGNVPLLVMLCQVVGNSFQVVIAALAVRRFTVPSPRFDNIFGNLKGASAFVFLAAMVAVRELLINVVKHSGVKEATVYVTHEEGVVIIDVEDQGKGFVPDALDLPRSHGGFGLFSIRERLSLLGGGLEIKSSPGNGTSAQVVIPVAASDPAGALPNLAS